MRRKNCKDSSDLVSRLILEAGIGDRSIRERLDFGNVVDDIHSEAAGASIEPELHHIVDSFTNSRTLPVQVGLLRCEQTQIVLLRLLVPRPA